MNIVKFSIDPVKTGVLASIFLVHAVKFYVNIDLITMFCFKENVNSD